MNVTKWNGNCNSWMKYQMKCWTNNRKKRRAKNGENETKATCTNVPTRTQWTSIWLVWHAYSSYHLTYTQLNAVSDIKMPCFGCIPIICLIFSSLVIENAIHFASENPENGDSNENMQTKYTNWIHSFAVNFRWCFVTLLANVYGGNFTFFHFKALHLYIKRWWPGEHWHISMSLLNVRNRNTNTCLAVQRLKNVLRKAIEWKEIFDEGGRTI